MVDMALIVTTKGFGKLVSPDEFPAKGRGSKGVIGYKVTDESGPVAGTAHVHTGKGQKVLIVTANGMALMTEVDGISARSRTAGGVKIMNVEDGDAVVSVLV